MIPSGGILEGIVEDTAHETRQEENKKHKFRQIGVIDRVNAYGNQSYCVQESQLKKLCFCL